MNIARICNSAGNLFVSVWLEDVYNFVWILRVFREALEVLTVINNLAPQTIEQISQDNTFFRFVLEMILLCATKAIRLAAAEQLLLISTQSQQHLMLNYFLSHLFKVLQNTVQTKEYAKNCHEFFQLLCRLLNFASTSNASFPAAESLLFNEIAWLKKARVYNSICFELTCTKFIRLFLGEFLKFGINSGRGWALGRSPLSDSWTGLLFRAIYQVWSWVGQFQGN